MTRGSQRTADGDVVSANGDGSWMCLEEKREHRKLIKWVYVVRKSLMDLSEKIKNSLMEASIEPLGGLYPVRSHALGISAAPVFTALAPCIAVHARVFRKRDGALGRESR